MLLQLLEDKSVVQSGSEQVRQRVENENVLREESALPAAFDIQCAEKSFAVSDGDAQHGARFRQNRTNLAFQAVLHQRPLTGPRHAPEDADAQWNPFAHGVRRGSGFRFDFDLLRTVIEQADADVIEAEVFLDLADNLAQHVDRIVAGNRRARDVIEERQLP